MAISRNRYNDPALGEAFNNIASIFAPPSAGDMANYANAAATREKASRLAQLFANPNDPNFDRLNIAVGNYAPTQSYYAVDEGNSVARRGQDITASTSITNNAADNARALETNLLDNQRHIATTSMSPLNPGQVTPGLPEGIAGMFGMPAIAGATGLDKPLSETEFAAQQQARLLAEGKLTDDDLLNAIAGDQTPVKIVGDNGPQFASPGAAVRTGATPYIEPSAGAAMKPVVLHDTVSGNTLPGMFNPANGQYTLQDGTPAPEGMVPHNLGSPTGSNADLGLGTKANLTRAQALQAAVSNTNGIVNALETLVTQNPAVTGPAGDILSFMQDAKQVVAEFGAAFGTDPNAPVSAADMKAFSDQFLGNGTSYNPTYRQARALLLELAYANAQMNNPSGEVSRFALERELEQLGQGAVGNDKGLLAVVDVARDRMRRKLGEADVLSGKAAPLTPDQIGQAPPAAGAPDPISEEWTRDANRNLVRAQ